MPDILTVEIKEAGAMPDVLTMEIKEASSMMQNVETPDKMVR